MKQKLKDSITKFINTDINLYQAAVYYNVYMLSSVFFGCGIILLNKKQEEELKTIYEQPLLHKIGFSWKFPRNVLYSRKTALDIGLIEPSTIIDILKLKLYIGNVRKGGNTSGMIKAHHEMQQIEAGKNTTMGENPDNRY